MASQYASASLQSSILDLWVSKCCLILGVLLLQNGHFHDPFSNWVGKFWKVGHTISVFPERESLGWLVPELLLIETLSENVAAISENVGWMGPTGWTGWLIIAVSWDVSSVAEEVVDL